MSSWQIRHAVSELHRGKVIAYPTEAVFGLGCDPWNEHAVYSLLALKNRPWQKGLILVAANLMQLEDFIEPINELTLAQQIQASWPGPITWALPAKQSVPDYLRGDHKTIAVRITAHKQTVELCRQFGGAVVSTSANKMARKPAKTNIEVRRQFPEVKMVLSGTCSGAEQPTQIRDGLTGEILR